MKPVFQTKPICGAIQKSLQAENLAQSRLNDTEKLTVTGVKEYPKSAGFGWPIHSLRAITCECKTLSSEAPRETLSAFQLKGSRGLTTMLKGQDQFMFLNNNSSTRVRFSIGIASLLAMFALSLWADQAVGQNFQSDPIAEKYIVPNISDPNREEKAEISRKVRALKADKTAVAKMLQGRQAMDNEVVEQFFTSYVFPQMTQTDDETLSRMGELRAEFVKVYLSERLTGSNRTFFIEEIALPRIRAIAGGNYHHAVRLNAVLLAGLINGVEPSRSTLPQASTPTIGLLLDVVSADQVPEYLKVGAMTGIHRNAMFDGKLPQSRMPGPEKTRIENLASAIMNQKAAGQDKWSAEVNYWLRRRAIQTLGFLKNPVHAPELITILNDTQEKNWIRLDATTALKDMQLAPANADAAVTAITRFAAEQLQNEATGTVAQMAELVEINMLYGNQNLMDDNNQGPRTVRPRGAGNGLNLPQSKIDLANYQLNQIRRRTKAIGFSINQAFETIGQQATETRATATSATRIIEEVMADIDEGLIDLSEQVEDELGDGGLLDNPINEEQPKAVADKLAEILQSAAGELNRLVGVEAPDEMKKEDQPAQRDSESPFG